MNARMSIVNHVVFAAVASMMVSVANGEMAPGQLERDPNNQSALLPGIATIQCGYVFGNNTPIKAFDGNSGVDNCVNLTTVNGDVNTGTNTAYGVDFGSFGA